MIKPLSKVTGKYIGKSFAEMPCMHLMYHLYTDLGYDAPDSFGELTLDNYQAHFKENSKLTQARMLQLLKWLGDPVPPDRLKIYDLVVVMQPGKSIFPAMYVGRRMFITSTIKEGVVVAPISRRNRIIMARRLV